MAGRSTETGPGRVAGGGGLGLTVLEKDNNSDDLGARVAPNLPLRDVEGQHSTLDEADDGT